MSMTTETQFDVRSEPGRATAPPPRPARTPAGFTKVWSRAAPVLLYLVVALVPMYPYRSSNLTTHPEVCWIVAGIIEARRSLDEGQFPVRVADHQQAGPRYPIFQFYGALPFNAGALISAAAGDRLDAYTIWKLVIWGSLAVGSYFTFLAACRLTRHRPAALLAGLAFLTAPYLFTDLRARGAVCEAMAMCFVPVALYGTIRAFESRRRLGYVPLAAVGWTLVALSHNITYLYAAVLVTLYMLPAGVGTVVGAARRRGQWRRAAGRFGRVVVAGVIHALLIAWYVAPALLAAKDLEIGKVGKAGASPMASAFLTPLDVLLAPVQTTPPRSTTALLGLQVGWPVAAAFVVVLLGVVLNPFRRVGGVRRGEAARLAVVFAVAFFLAWSPVDVWAWLPPVFYFVQYTFRLLVFVAVFGALLTAVAVATSFPEGRRRLGAGAMALALFVLATSAATYVNDCPTFAPDKLAELAAAPQIGVQSDFLLNTAATSRTSHASPGDDLADPHWGVIPPGRVLHDGVRATVPVAAGATSLTLAGELPGGQPGPVKVEMLAGGTHVWQIFEPGPFRLTVPVNGTTSPNGPGGPPAPNAGTMEVLILIVCVPPGEPQRPGTARIASLAWDVAASPAALPQRVVVPPERTSVRSRGRPTWMVDSADGPALAQLPALFYPDLLEVRVDGKRVPYGNVGRMVAVEVPAGRHRVDVRFAGLGWANVASAAGVLLLVGAIVAPPGTRGARRYRGRR